MGGKQIVHIVRFGNLQDSSCRIWAKRKQSLSNKINRTQLTLCSDMFIKWNTSRYINSWNNFTVKCQMQMLYCKTLFKMERCWLQVVKYHIKSRVSQGLYRRWHLPPEMSSSTRSCSSSWILASGPDCSGLTLTVWMVSAVTPAETSRHKTLNHL